MEGLTEANMEAFVGSMPGIAALRWLKRLTDYAGQKSFNIARPPGAIVKKWNLSSWSGLAGSVIAG